MYLLTLGQVTMGWVELGSVHLPLKPWVEKLGQTGKNMSVRVMVAFVDSTSSHYWRTWQVNEGLWGLVLDAGPAFEQWLPLPFAERPYGRYLVKE